MKRKIERISADVAEKITTAQVVVSLSSALRQLVDNSIDAQATIIDIRAKNNGFDSLEVQDNGCGIEEKNFEALCKAHSTSKLSDFSDFDKLSTLGFRGEALNALCALSTVTIFTRSELSDTPLGTRLKFDHRGNIIERSCAAREIGTTILVEGLFETLPVRRKELERTAKKDFLKLLTMVQSFALMCPQIKFLCTNFVGGKKQNLICTPGGNSTVHDVVSNIFGNIGGRQEKAPLIELKMEKPTEEICILHSIPKGEEFVFDWIEISGFISSCEHGNGRSTSDRQFVYINNRPIDYSRVCSVINEVYKQFNKSQYPIVVIFIKVPSDRIDVNVTPDKKTVMFEKEKHLLAIIRSTVLATFQPILGDHSSVKSSVEDWRNRDSFYATSSADTTLDHSQLDNSTLTENSTTCCDQSLPNVEDLLRGFRSRKSVRHDEPTAKRQKESEKKARKDITLADFSFTCEKSEDRRVEMPSIRKTAPKVLENLSKGFDNYSQKDDDIFDKTEDGIDTLNTSQSSQTSQDPFADDVIENLDEMASQEIEIVAESQSQGTYVRPQQNIKFSMKRLKERYEKMRAIDESEGVSMEEEFGDLKLTPEMNEEAERQLSRALKKNDFMRMRVIGQFNKGFIICNLGTNLFIVDQHASDEKYNFEKLQNRAKLTKQPLFTPTPLNFGAVQEMIIRENLAIFHANGFDFDFRENDGCCKAYMTSRPEILSQNLTNSDLDEIVAMVAEYPHQMYRPTKIRKIFASRACRKSVMIGMGLNEKQMIRIVKNLASLDQPWNCPHGRPTIRHLATL